ncbi:hypothetical protein ACA910_007890 [Epithemia clementina (nom. ined.)]
MLPESQVQPTITAVPFRDQQQEHLDNFNYMKERVSQLELEIHRTNELAREVSRLRRLVTQLKHEKQVIRTNFSQYVKDDGKRKTTQAYLPETTATVSNSKIKGTQLVEAAETFVNTLQCYAFDGTKSTLYTECVASTISDLLWDDLLVGGLLVEQLMCHAKSSLSKTDFAPDKILRAMDARGGVLNYEGLEIIRRCETRGKRYARNTIIPSVA